MQRYGKDAPLPAHDLAPLGYRTALLAAEPDSSDGWLSATEAYGMIY